jgi:hypothetical protein
MGERWKDCRTDGLKDWIINLAVPVERNEKVAEQTRPSGGRPEVEVKD